MYNTPYFIPNSYSLIAPPIIRNTALNGIRAQRGIGLFQKLGNSLKSVNWTGMINNTSKTLGIINQSIPIVKQVGPMMNNMKSMIRIASIFKDETDNSKKRNIHNQNYNNTYTNSTSIKKENQEEDYYSPTFFIS